MPDPTKNIDALLDLLAAQSHIRFHSALTALVAERDSLKQRVAVLESQEFTLPRDPFRDPDRDLRERLVCAVMTGLCADPTFDGNVVRSAIAYADEAITEMRKEEA